MKRYTLPAICLAMLLMGCGRDTSLENTGDIFETEAVTEEVALETIEDTTTTETTEEESLTEASATGENKEDVFLEIDNIWTTQETVLSDRDQLLKEEKEKYGVVAATGDFITKGKVNVRTGPSTRYDIVMVMGKDAHIPIIGVANTGWYQVSITKEDGTELIAYMSNKWLDGEFEKEVVVSCTEYNPASIVKKATKIAVKAGYTKIKDDLENQLINNEISRETYDFLLPYGKSSYTMVSIISNLEDAVTIDGEELTTEKEIANYLVSRLLTEEDTCFAFSYNGSFRLGNKKYYEFRCYKY